jgi:hypothetical protein
MVTSRSRQAMAAAPAPEVTSLMLPRSLRCQPHGVEYRRRHHDGGAVLVVMEDGDVHPLAQLAFDVEALRGLDVLKIDAAEGGLHRGDHVHQLVRVPLVQLDVEHVDVGELLEQHTLALHHRLGGEGAHRTQPQDCGTVGDHADQVGARGKPSHLGGIPGDQAGGGRDAGRIGEGEIPLVGQPLGGNYRDLSGRGEAVIVESGLLKRGLVHGSMGSWVAGGSEALIHARCPMGEFGTARPTIHCPNRSSRSAFGRYIP